MSQNATGQSGEPKEDSIGRVFNDFEKSGPPFANQTSKLQYEALRDYLLPLLEAHTQRKVIEARIDELNNVIGDGDMWYVTWRNPKPYSKEVKTITIQERIAELKALNHRKDD